MNKTSNENVNYIIECAEYVGITIDENTPIDFALIAEIMRRLRKDNERH
jgi:hypothetical protein